MQTQEILGLIIEEMRERSDELSDKRKYEMAEELQYWIDRLRTVIARANAGWY